MKLYSTEDRNDQSESQIFRTRDSIPEIYPVCKASVVKHGHVYYLPVSFFPIPSRERDRLNHFLAELCRHYAQLVEGSLSSYLSISNSVVKNEVLRQLVANMFDWRPRQMLALTPNQPPPQLPSEQEMNHLQQDFSIEKIHEMLPMMTFISRKSAVQSAYQTLFGAGGSCFYVSPLKEREFVRTMREVFGYRIEDPIFQALGCLPHFKMEILLEATGRQFEALYSVVDLYIGESLPDGGLVITSKVCLDQTLAELAKLIKDRRSDRTSQYQR